MGGVVGLVLLNLCFIGVAVFGYRHSKAYPNPHQTYEPVAGAAQIVGALMWIDLSVYCAL